MEKRGPESKLEEVIEETYPDLLPYEMERAEAAMDILFGLDRKGDELLKEDVSAIRSDMVKAKMAKKNRWGHDWRPSPDIRDQAPVRDRYGMLKPLPPPTLGRDPICEKALSEYRKETEDDDNVPATD